MGVSSIALFLNIDRVPNYKRLWCWILTTVNQQLSTYYHIKELQRCIQLTTRLSIPCSF